jgi:hypothetical protein
MTFHFKFPSSYPSPLRLLNQLCHLPPRCVCYIVEPLWKAHRKLDAHGTVRLIFSNKGPTMPSPMRRGKLSIMNLQTSLCSAIFVGVVHSMSPLTITPSFLVKCLPLVPRRSGTFRYWTVLRPFADTVLRRYRQVPQRSERDILIRKDDRLLRASLLKLDTSGRCHVICSFLSNRGMLLCKKEAKAMWHTH